MNQIQQAIAKVTGLDEVIEENQQIFQALEHADSQNALLQRQIDDLDYLNLFDLHSVTEVIPIADRKKHYNKLRRLRQENPLAKQAVKLILRFTLGRGVQISIGPDPEKQLESDSQPQLPDSDDPAPKLNGLFPGPRNNNSRANAGIPPLKRSRPQVGEAEELDDEDQLKEIIEEFWKDGDNQKALTSHEAMKEWLDEVVTDGEHFMVCFTSEAAPYVRLTSIAPEEITDIVYHPENHKIPLYYKRNWQELKFDGESGQYTPDGDPKERFYLDHSVDIESESFQKAKSKVRIPASKYAGDDVRVMHRMINPLWTKKGKRGISELFASREWFRVYKEFVEDRAAINAAATAVAYKRKIKAGPTGVANFQGKFGGIDVGYDNPNNNTEIRRLTRPVAAGTYDSNPAVDLEWMKTDTGAVNAKEDGRSLMSAAGAGMGIFIHYFGEGGDSNLATAQSMELPMVKTFEDWQEWVNSTILELLLFVITIATDLENAKKQIDRVSGTFPPLISQDVVKYTTAWSQISQNIAPGNKVVQQEAIRGALGVMNVPNLDALMTRIAASQEAADIEQAAQQQAQLDAMRQGLGEEDPSNPVKDGNGNGMDPMMKRIASGKPEPARNGPKPPRG